MTDGEFEGVVRAVIDSPTRIPAEVAGVPSVLPVHESVLRSYHALRLVLMLLESGVPGPVAKQITDDVLNLALRYGEAA